MPPPPPFRRLRLRFHYCFRRHFLIADFHAIFFAFILPLPLLLFADASMPPGRRHATPLSPLFSMARHAAA
jgi:hypothetical protein